jgi:hypothetical protein
VSRLQEWKDVLL